MSFFKSIGNAIYREYDRRIKRASLVTEYGAQHHNHSHDEHGAEGAVDQHAGAPDTAANLEEAEEAEIVNVPRGTPVASGQATPAPSPTEAKD
jgi:hypothetical protein